MAPAAPALQARGGRAHLRRAPRGLGGPGPPRLRRRGIQRAPHLPVRLMNSPNLLAAAAAQRTRRLKLLVYGNLLPLHDPLRLAEELAMLDCMSNGRIVSGFAR